MFYDASVDVLFEEVFDVVALVAGEDGDEGCGERVSESVVAVDGLGVFGGGVEADDSGGGLFAGGEVVEGGDVDIAAVLADDFDELVDAVEVVFGGGDVGDGWRGGAVL